MESAHSASAPGNDTSWDLDIRPQGRGVLGTFRELNGYRDLLLLLVKRDFTTYYRQTILGPAWFLIQPLMRILIYYIIFARVAGVPTDGVPPLLFYLTGILFWEFFAASWRRVGNTFLENQHIFSKVYFPRIVMPISSLLSNAMKWALQCGLWVVFFVYYAWQGAQIAIHWQLCLLPIYLVIVANLAIGSGLIFAALTAKYRDLKFLLDTIIQLLLYLTPVLYPLSLATGRYKVLLLLNPMTGVMEAIKYSMLGNGVFSWNYLLYSALVSVVLLFSGLRAFRQVERNFIDTV